MQAHFIIWSMIPLTTSMNPKTRGEVASGIQPKVSACITWIQALKSCGRAIAKGKLKCCTSLSCHGGRLVGGGVVYEGQGPGS